MLIFCDVINDLLISKNINQRQLSLKTNISTTDVSEYCSGTLPNIPNLVKLANFFDCSTDYLLGIKEEDKIKNFNASYVYAFENFYNTLLNLVKDKNLTFYKLSKIIGVHKNTIYNWKNGVNPSCLTLIKLSEYFGVSVDYLVGRTDNM